MPVLTANGLAQSYGTRVVLDGVALTIDRGERVGLVGANGSGKSTLGRILAGAEQADAGTVVIRKGARIAYLGQEPRFAPNATVLDAATVGIAEWCTAFERHEAASEAIARGDGDLSALLDTQAAAAAEVERLGGWSVDSEARAMLSRVGIEDLSRDVATLSGGEQRRVDLARVLVSRRQLLVLDEPTNHLDVSTIEWLESHLCNEQKGALLLITHDRYFLDRVVTRTAELDQGALRVYVGGWTAYVEAKLEREAHAARAEKNRQNFLRRELEWLRRGPKARTTKQKARVQRAEAVTAVKAPTRQRTVALEVETQRSGKTILETDSLCLDLGGKRLIESLTLALTDGERIGIIGRNGTGKTSLLRMVLGELPPTSGRIVVGKNAQITYLGQHREGLDESKSVMENVAGKRTLLTLAGREMSVHGYLERFLFDGGQQRQLVGLLSGGEKARVLLAKLLLRPTNLLILDEPTNDLDTLTLGALEQLIVDLGVTVLVVTHDRYFLDRIATSMLVFEGDGQVVRYPGNYEMVRRLRAAAEQSDKASAKGTKGNKGAKRKTAPKKAASNRAKKRELESLFEEVERTEAKIARLEEQLADPDTYREGGEGTADLVRELNDTRSELDRLMARWETLEDS